MAFGAFAGAALAAGYDDFTSGLTANLRGHYEQAISAFTAAIAAPDLVPEYRSAVYYSRANAYLNLGKCQEARFDIAAFEQLEPADNPVVALRMWVNLCLKDSAAARKDLAILSVGHSKVNYLFDFSRLQWKYGLFADAAASAKEAFAGYDRKSYMLPYILLWQAMNEMRAGTLDAAAMSAEVTSLPDDDWPRAVFDLYLGKSTPEAVQRAAGSMSYSREDAQRCEANFYTAQWHLTKNNVPAATELLLAVMGNCPIDYIERAAAADELKRLGVTLPKE